METIINKSIMYVWLVAAVVIAIIAIAKGAWWHVGSALICWLMYDAFKGEGQEEQAEKE